MLILLAFILLVLIRSSLGRKAKFFVDQLEKNGLVQNPEFLLVDPSEENIGVENSVVGSSKRIGRIGDMKLYKAVSKTQDSCTLYHLTVNKTTLTKNVGIKNTNRFYLKFNYFQMKKIQNDNAKYMIYTIFLFLLLDHIMFSNTSDNEEIFGLFIPREEVLYWNKISIPFLQEFFMTSSEYGVDDDDTNDEETRRKNVQNYFLLFQPVHRNTLREIVDLCAS